MPSPYEFLNACLQRKIGLGAENVTCELSIPNGQKETGKLAVTAEGSQFQTECGNGLQMAAQGMLQILHPRINYWGPLLHLYEPSSLKTFKENAAPNARLLGKLHEAMRERQKNNPRLPGEHRIPASSIGSVMLPKQL